MGERMISRTLLAAGAAFALLFCLAPFGYMLAVSAATRPDFLSPGVPFRLTADHLRAVTGEESLHFLDYLRNSLVISVLSAAACIAIASLAAYAVTRLRFRGKMGLLLFALAVSMFPQIGLVGYLYKVMSRLGWINTYQGLALPYVAWGLPLALWVLVSYFSSIPTDLDKAALVDGCTRVQALVKVVFPVALPGVFSAFLLAFILAFNEFMFALMLTTDYHAQTIPVGIALFQGLHGQMPWGQIMAASALTVAPVVVLTLVFQRHIIGGLTRGAVKG